MKRYHLYHDPSSVRYFFHYVPADMVYHSAPSVVAAYRHISSAGGAIDRTTGFAYCSRDSYELIAECDSLSDLEDSHPELFI